MKTVDAIKIANLIIIARSAHAGKVLKLIQRMRLAAMTSMSAHRDTSKKIHFLFQVTQKQKFTSSCQQQCINTIGSFRCECYPGYRMNEIGQCLDINECDVENTANIRCPKTANCINTAGSYKCVCPDGQKLSRDRTECIEIKNECKPLMVKNGHARCTRSR